MRFQNGASTSRPNRLAGATRWSQALTGTSPAIRADRGFTAGPAPSSRYPGNNSYPPSAAAGILHSALGAFGDVLDALLPESSPLAHLTTDGLLPGADLAAVARATANVVQR